jgi:hypothetical protein
MVVPNPLPERWGRSPTLGFFHPADKITVELIAD